MQKAKQKEPKPVSPLPAVVPKPTIVDMKKQTASTAPYNAAGYTTGTASASLTSTSAVVSTKSERALVDEEEWMFERILPGEKGYVAMQTNFGKLNIELFCDKVGCCWGRNTIRLNSSCRHRKPATTF